MRINFKHYWHAVFLSAFFINLNLMPTLAFSSQKIAKTHKLTSCSFEARKYSRLHIKKQCLKKLSFDRSGVEMVNVTNHYSYVDKKGKVLIDGGVYDPVATFSNGMGRYYITSEAKPQCGYFNKKYEISIQAKYDGCERFKDSKAFVCKDCVEYCTDIDCHDHVFIGGDGHIINKSGKILWSGKNKGIDEFCPPPSTLKKHLDKNPPYISCERQITPINSIR